MGWKPANFTIKTMHICLRCDGRDVQSHTICAGCRHNGDGYGTFLTYCKACGYLQWGSYDEAQSD